VDRAPTIRGLDRNRVFVAFSPAWQKLPSFARQMLRVAGHAGSYGTGSATILDTNSYFPAF